MEAVPRTKHATSRRCAAPRARATFQNISISVDTLPRVMSAHSLCGKVGAGSRARQSVLVRSAAGSISLPQDENGNTIICIQKCCTLRVVHLAMKEKYVACPAPVLPVERESCCARRRICSDKGGNLRANGDRMYGDTIRRIGVHSCRRAISTCRARRRAADCTVLEARRQCAGLAVLPVDLHARLSSLRDHAHPSAIRGAL